MLAPWLLYAIALGALASGIALLSDRMLRWYGRGARGVWFAAIVVTVTVPVVRAVIPRQISNTPAVASSTRAAPARTTLPDSPIVIAWLLGSLWIAGRTASAAVALRRRRRGWSAARVGNRTVLLSDDLGPALIGWRRFTTVLPKWALSLDADAHALMLQHEEEHARTGDPHLLHVALLGVIAMPWNPMVWWLLRRLRVALELDCDQRLLARGVDPRQYASLLLAVGERISATPFAWATAFAGSRSSLELRILAMTSSIRPRHYRLAIGGAGLVAAGLIAIACASPVPDPVVPPVAAGVAKTSVQTHDSASVVVSDCAVGSTTCSLAPKGYVIYRKTIRDQPCNGEASCEADGKEMNTTRGYSVVADTVFLYQPKRAGECAADPGCAAEAARNSGNAKHLDAKIRSDSAKMHDDFELQAPMLTRKIGDMVTVKSRDSVPQE